jgi:hypothetical protein
MGSSQFALLGPVCISKPANGKKTKSENLVKIKVLEAPQGSIQASYIYILDIDIYLFTYVFVYLLHISCPYKWCFPVGPIMPSYAIPG